MKRESSYYEIALTNRQVLLLFSWLLLGILLTFLGGLWIGKSGGSVEIDGKESTYQEKLAAIEQLRTGTEDVLEFIDSQKRNLQAERENLNTVRKERASLEPLLDADRQVVESLFEQQEKRQRDKTWAERVVGFGLGIVASMFASFILMRVSRR